MFLFNPNGTTLTGEFALTKESIGLTGKGPFRFTQEYPPSERNVKAAAGETVRWKVPAQTAVVLRVQ